MFHARETIVPNMLGEKIHPIVSRQRDRKETTFKSSIGFVETTNGLPWGGTRRPKRGRFLHTQEEDLTAISMAIDKQLLQPADPSCLEGPAAHKRRMAPWGIGDLRFQLVRSGFRRSGFRRRCLVHGKKAIAFETKRSVIFFLERFTLTDH